MKVVLPLLLCLFLPLTSFAKIKHAKHQHRHHRVHRITYLMFKKMKKDQQKQLLRSYAMFAADIEKSIPGKEKPRSALLSLFSQAIADDNEEVAPRGGKIESPSCYYAGWLSKAQYAKTGKPKEDGKTPVRFLCLHPADAKKISGYGADKEPCADKNKVQCNPMVFGEIECVSAGPHPTKDCIEQAGGFDKAVEYLLKGEHQEEFEKFATAVGQFCDGDDVGNQKNIVQTNIRDDQRKTCDLLKPRVDEVWARLMKDSSPKDIKEMYDGFCQYKNADGETVDVKVGADGEDDETLKMFVGDKLVSTYDDISVLGKTGKKGFSVDTCIGKVNFPKANNVCGNPGLAADKAKSPDSGTMVVEDENKRICRLTEHLKIEKGDWSSDEPDKKPVYKYHYKDESGTDDGQLTCDDDKNCYFTMCNPVVKFYYREGHDGYCSVSLGLTAVANPTGKKTVTPTATGGQ